jgi:hypothetical protein
VYFVLNGDENGARKIKLSTTGVWEGTWTGLRVLPGDYASLRLSGARTWGRSFEIIPDSQPRTALFRFECNRMKTRDEQIESAPEIPFTCCRRLRKKEGSKDPLDREIMEWSDSTDIQVIKDWRYPREEVRLLLFSTNHNCKVRGVTLNALEVIKKGKEPAVLTEADIKLALCVQYAIGVTSPPRIPPNGCEVPDERLKDLTVTLTKVK